MTRPARRGAALLLVLGAVVVVLAVLQVGMSTRWWGASVAILDHRDAQQWQLLADADAVIAAWCERHGATMTADPASPMSGLILVDRSWTMSGNADGEPGGRIQVRIWDACGGLPVAALATGHPIAGSVGAPWSALIGQVPPTPDVLETLRLPPGVRQFPVEPAAGPAQPSCAVGLAIHGEGSVNINTAPLDMIEAVARWNGLSLDLRALAAERHLGKPSGLPRMGSPLADLADVRLVDRTDRWQALITITHQGRTTAWWTVYRLGIRAVTGSLGEPPGGWTPAGPGTAITIVQRHVVW
jgi:hypothetical protein